MVDACRHNRANQAEVDIVYLEDTGRYILDLRAWCLDCGYRFRFLGMPMGLLPDQPTVSVDGFEASLPVEPEMRTQEVKPMPGFRVREAGFDH
jgi:hypothetical protein